MKKNIKNLIKIIGLFSIIFHSECIMADDENTWTWHMSEHFENFFDTGTITLCEEGQYLKSCRLNDTDGGWYEWDIGTNWLKNVRIFVYTGPGTIHRVAVNLYDESTTDNHNMKNLRSFFASSGSIIATNDNNTTASTEGDFLKVVQAKNQMLEYYCYDEEAWDAVPFPVTCAPCPNGASVPASKINTDGITTDTYLSSENFWEIHTIADCYTDNSFSDRTGFYYFENDDDDTENEITPCYYGIEVKGATNLEDKQFPTN